MAGQTWTSQPVDLDLTIEVNGRTLFDVKLAGICLYSRLSRPADALCRNVDGLQERILKVEFYEEYSPWGRSSLETPPPMQQGPRRWAR